MCFSNIVGIYPSQQPTIYLQELFLPSTIKHCLKIPLWIRDLWASNVTHKPDICHKPLLHNHELEPNPPDVHAATKFRKHPWLVCKRAVLQTQAKAFCLQSRRSPFRRGAHVSKSFAGEGGTTPSINSLHRLFHPKFLGFHCGANNIIGQMCDRLYTWNMTPNPYHKRWPCQNPSCIQTSEKSKSHKVQSLWPNTKKSPWWFCARLFDINTTHWAHPKGALNDSAQLLLLTMLRVQDHPDKQPSANCQNMFVTASLLFQARCRNRIPKGHPYVTPPDLLADHIYTIRCPNLENLERKSRLKIPMRKRHQQIVDAMSHSIEKLFANMTSETSE